MEPNDVDCNANNVHAQAQFHLQAKANIHIQSQSSTDAATKASRGVPSKKEVHTISDVLMPDAE